MCETNGVNGSTLSSLT